LKLKFILQLLICMGSVAMAQNAPLWLRYPAISPDGKTIVFSYKGDLFKVPTEGGRALPLTLYDGRDFMPVWSNDGTKISFASDRYGNFDVFVMPADGGEARRLTFHSANDYPYDFAGDDQSVLFGSTRLDHVDNAMFPSGVLSELYQVALSGGQPDQVLTIPAEDAQFSPDGGSIIFHDRKGYEDPWRKHHTSSVTRDLWVYQLGTGDFHQLTTYAGEDRTPRFSNDGSQVYFLREAGGTFNVFKMDPGNPQSASQLTRYDDHPVRFLSRADNGLLCYSYNGELYTLRDGSQPAKVAIQIETDAQDRGDRVLKVNSGASEMAVSPNGKEIAFIRRGEVFVTSVESGKTKQITKTPEQERSLSFHPDGKKLLYAAERNQSWNLYESKISRDVEKYFFNATLIEETPLLVSDAETFQPSYSPNGEEVAYIEDRTGIKVINLASKKIREIMPKTMSFSYADGDQYFQWSPDSNWLLATYQLPGYWSNEVGLFRADGTGEVVNLTQSGYFDHSPKWMMEGKMMMWLSNRDGMRSQATSGGSEDDVYALFFTQEAFDRFQLSKEELELLKEREEEDKPGGDDDAEESDNKASKKKKDKSKKDKKDKDDKKKVDPIKIELEGIRDRETRLTIHSANISDAVVTPDGEKLLYLARFEKGYDLWVTEFRTKETKILAKLGGRGGSLTLDKDGKNLFILSAGKLKKLDISSGKPKGIGFSTDMVLDPAAERAYLFDHAWRQVREKFYQKGLHGAKWETLKTRYQQFLPHINNNYDFAEMLGELLGELNASHTGARYRHNDPEGDDTASLGVYFDRSFDGPGLRVAEVMPKSPLTASDSKIGAGSIIQKIDGVTITQAVNLAKLLNRKAGENTLLSGVDKDGKAFEQVIKPISRGEENRLRYERWVEKKRAMVDKLSNGKLGYVHVRSMGDSSFRTVIEEVMGSQVTKEALVVDTRFNGGGDLVNDLSIFLSGKRYMTFLTNDNRKIGYEPTQRWSKPSIVLAGEGNYSDAHCFPWAYSHLNIGKVVGMPVPGTCTFVWWERLQDPTLVFGIPNMAVTDMDGQALENSQLDPDITVRNEPAEVIKGRDQQLERAVEELLKELGQ